ncbi:MAG: AMP-binding protein [Clostridia bacterium]|nr:AMP-binding protein [Clostridia bacterium]
MSLAKAPINDRKEELTYFDQVVETMDREELKKLQFNKLKAMINELYGKNKFYTEKWKAAGINSPDDIKTWEDFQRLPFTRKSELVQDQEKNGPYGSNMTYSLDKYVRFHQTSGTTGKPLKWLDTDESWNWFARCWAHVFKGAGVTEKDIIIFPFTFGPFVGFWSAFEAARIIGAISIPAGGQDTITRINSILENKPTVIACTPSYALRLAEAAAEQGIDMSKSSIIKTIHAGEPGASIPSTKKKLEQSWGAKCYDHHGMTEMGAISFECQVQPGSIHLIESEFIVEVINPETGLPCADGESGELILTNLGRWGMPNIRYRTGDRVILNVNRCDCGRTFARIEGGVIGRVDDMLIIRGVNVFPSALENIIRNYPEVAEFMIEVHKVKEMDDLKLKLEIDQNQYSAEKIKETINAIVEEVRNKLQIRVETEHAAAGTLPRFEMKAKRLVRIS